MVYIKCSSFTHKLQKMEYAKEHLYCSPNFLNPLYYSLLSIVSDYLADIYNFQISTTWLLPTQSFRLHLSKVVTNTTPLWHRNTKAQN